jgi:hypothetical protein
VTVVLAVFFALFLLLMMSADLLPTQAERRAGLVAL